MGKIAEGIMRRDHAAFVRWNPANGLHHLTLEAGELGDIGRGIVFERLAILLICRTESSRDVVDIDLGIADALERMRVDRALPFASLLGGEGSRNHAFRGHGDLRLGAAGINEAGDPALKPETVDYDDTGLRNPLEVHRSWLIDMGIAIGADERHDRHMVPADFLGEIAQDGEAGNDFEPFL